MLSVHPSVLLFGGYSNSLMLVTRLVFKTHQESESFTQTSHLTFVLLTHPPPVGWGL